MKFVEATADVAAQEITARISDELRQDKRVLWLVCGGSSIATEAKIMKLLRETVPDKLAFLAILPTDERYGPPGHPDSNAQQLREAGFDPGEATWIDILTHDVPLDQTVSFYSDVAATAFASAAVIIAVFGMGANAHIAGLQPGSPAVDDDVASAVGYDWEDFTRLTLTAEMLRRVDVAYALVYGESKHEALERLQRNEEPYAELPAKLLYELPEATIYNDYITEE